MDEIKFIETCIYDGFETHIIKVEVDSSKSIPGIYVVGMVDVSIRESSARIRSAIKNIGIDLPLQKYIINLSPASLRKQGSSMDLAIAVSILLRLKIIDSIFSKFWSVAELSLSGDLRRTEKIYPIILRALSENISGLILSVENYEDVLCLRQKIDVSKLEIFFCKNLKDIVDGDLVKLSDENQSKNDTIFKSKDSNISNLYLDEKWNLIKSQTHAKRALQIGLSGKHHMFFAGPKGVGKSSIVEFSKFLLPDLEHDELLDVLNLHPEQNIKLEKTISRPFRSPHSSISAGSMLGSSRSYGEITFAHNGILFLDEFSEFNRAVIESLRQPLEHKCIDISRVDRKIKAKANFILIAASNLCRCGGYGKNESKCKCTQLDRDKYFSKISGPVLDRIDVQVVLDDVQSKSESSTLKQSVSPNEFTIIKEQIKNVWEVQKSRFKTQTVIYNGQLTNRELEQLVLSEDETNKYFNSIKQLFPSFRSHNAILKIARTIADIEGKKKVTAEHIAEAVTFRVFS